jgi:hypothetical protein
MADHGSDTLTRRMTDRHPARPALEILLGDVVRLRRRHPCGATDWLVDRLGADIGLRCQGCGRHVLIERRVLERRLVSIVMRGDPAVTAALQPMSAPVTPVRARAAHVSAPAAAVEDET